MEIIMSRLSEKKLYRGRYLTLFSGMFLFLIGSLMAILHPSIGYSIYSLLFMGGGTAILGVGELVLLISDLWFVGNKFDPIYRDKILDSKNKEKKYKLPFAGMYPSLRPYRTMMYSWRLVGKKMSDSSVFGNDDLRLSASIIDIILAWLTISLFILSIVLLVIGAVLS